MSKRKTLKDHIDTAINKHGKGRYDYSRLPNNLTSRKTVSIGCNILDNNGKRHGFFNQLWCNHVQGHGCKKCQSVKNSVKIDFFKIKVSKIWGSSVLVYDDTFAGTTSLVCCFCNIHKKDFWIQGSSLIRKNRPSGCQLCGEARRDLHSKNRMLIRRRDDRLIRAHNFQNKLLKIRPTYMINKNKFSSVHNHLEVFCSKKLGGCGDHFNILRPYHLLNPQNNYCKCTKSKWHRENVMRDAFKMFFGKKYHKDIDKTYRKTCKTIGTVYNLPYSNKKCDKLKPDFILKLKDVIIASEYNGPHHYAPVDIFTKCKKKSYTNFQDIQRRDKLKRHWCHMNKVNLLIIKDKCVVDDNDIIKAVAKFLVSPKIQSIIPTYVVNRVNRYLMKIK